jgi:phage shock protein A
VARCGPGIGHHRGVSTAAEISSLSSSLQELHERVTSLAEGALARGEEDMAHELIAVERSLGGALRRLRRFAQARGV